MTKIKLDEISLVDFPAHMVNGFAVIKSATDQDSDALMSALEKRNSEMPEAIDLTKALSEASVEDITKALAARADVADIAKAVTPAEPNEDDIFKSLPEPVRVLIEKQAEKLAEIEKAAKASEEQATIEKAARLDGEAIAKSKEEYTNLAFEHETVAPALRKFAEADAESAGKIVELLKAVNAQADGAIFKEFGTNQPAPTSDAETGLMDVAKSLVTAGTAKDMPEAIAKALADPANKSLADAYFSGE